MGRHRGSRAERAVDCRRLVLDLPRLLGGPEDLRGAGRCFRAPGSFDTGPAGPMLKRDRLLYLRLLEQDRSGARRATEVCGCPRGRALWARRREGLIASDSCPYGSSLAAAPTSLEHLVCKQGQLCSRRGKRRGMERRCRVPKGNSGGSLEGLAVQPGAGQISEARSPPERQIAH